MKRERYQKYAAYMESCMGDSAHDAGHVYRVLYAALLLSRGVKNVDMDVLITAALLHDVGRAEQFRTGRCHAQTGARMAKEYLAGQGESEAFSEHVSCCIRTHRFRSDDPPATVEAKILYDADKLDVSGALGAARTLVYQGHVGHPIYSVGPDGGVLSGEEKQPSFYSEYRHKLHGISQRFLTAGGRKMALKRAETMQRFVENLRSEAAAGESGSAWRILPKTASAKQRRIFNMALMLAGDNEKLSRQQLAEAVMQGTDAGGVIGRVLSDAEALEGMGALGVATRLIEMGSRRRPIEEILDTEWAEASFHTAQARGIANARRAAGEDFLIALAQEMEEGRSAGEMMLSGILEK